jgi:endonuclease YncB( thermonuclease family)
VVVAVPVLRAERAGGHRDDTAAGGAAAVSAPQPNYAHRATFLQGHDGDSFWLSTDFGMNVAGVKLVLPTYIRLAGIDTWEIPPAHGSPADPNFEKGYGARDFANSALTCGKPVVVQTIKPSGAQVGKDAYGRWLARVFVGDDELSDLLRANGFEKAKT